MEWPDLDDGLPHIGEHAAGKASLMEKPKGREENRKWGERLNIYIGLTPPMSGCPTHPPSK
jgi:hypothetical protein